LAAAALLAANLGWMLWRGAPAPPQREASAGSVSVSGGQDASVRDMVPAAAPVSQGGRQRQAVPAVASPAPRPAPDGDGAPSLPADLLLPVQGVRVADLVDTFDDARGSERRHEALDIMAPAGTPVLAVADGHVEKLFDSERGGLTIYQFEDTGTWCYYYAHLQSYAPGLAEGQAVERGEVIGYVGSSGNAD